ncbi:MAG: TIGR02452 family protein [bacterium]|nr:TIGR02452 family protein [bacterium]
MKNNKDSISRTKRSGLAEKTLRIIKQGFYTTKEGVKVDITTDHEQAIENSVLYRPGDFEDLIRDNPEDQRSDKTIIEVTNESTLDAAQRLYLTKEYKNITCLNFASAKNPGGGFLGGSQAQEESLARSSALYATLIKHMEYYEFNRSAGDLLYSHHLVYSPQVPVFRNDKGDLLDDYYTVSFITAPAVNAGALKKNQPEKVPQIRSCMEERTANVLKTALYHKSDALVLGAWGCGVFRNDPAEVADIFYNALMNEKEFLNCFPHIVFAVYDRSKNKLVYNTFYDTFA